MMPSINALIRGVIAKIGADCKATRYGQVARSIQRRVAISVASVVPIRIVINKPITAILIESQSERRIGFSPRCSPTDQVKKPSCTTRCGVGNKKRFCGGKTRVDNKYQKPINKINTITGPAKSLTRFRSVSSRGASSTRKLGGTDWSIVLVTLMLFDLFIRAHLVKPAKPRRKSQRTWVHIATSEPVDN